MKDTKFILLGEHTYGTLNTETNRFWCTHGAWEGKVTFINDQYCKIDTVREKISYIFIEEIPEDYNYT